MKQKQSQSGQTLIEVIVAIYILTMALVAGLGLAIFSNTRNVNNRNTIIATNLAREGIEAVRMMRDTNWLSAQDIPSVVNLVNCTFRGGVIRPCYPEAFDEPNDLQHSTNSNDYRIVFNPSTAQTFTLDRRNGSETFLLCIVNGTYMHHSSCTYSNSEFARKVSIRTGNTSDPFTIDDPTPDERSGHSPEKVVISTLIWQTGKGCVPFTGSATTLNPDTFSTKCKITIRESLTNWKDYE